MFHLHVTRQRSGNCTLCHPHDGRDTGTGDLTHAAQQGERRHQLVGDGAFRRLVEQGGEVDERTDEDLGRSVGRLGLHGTEPHLAEVALHSDCRFDDRLSVTDIDPSPSLAGSAAVLVTTMPPACWPAPKTPPPMPRPTLPAMPLPIIQFVDHESGRTSVAKSGLLERALRSPPTRTRSIVSVFSQCCASSLRGTAKLKAISPCSSDLAVSVVLENGPWYRSSALGTFLPSASRTV